MALNPLQI